MNDIHVKLIDVTCLIHLLLSRILWQSPSQQLLAKFQKKKIWCGVKHNYWDLLLEKKQQK